MSLWFHAPGRGLQRFPLNPRIFEIREVLVVNPHDVLGQGLVFGHEPSRFWLSTEISP